MPRSDLDRDPSRRRDRGADTQTGPHARRQTPRKEAA